MANATCPVDGHHVGHGDGPVHPSVSVRIKAELVLRRRGATAEIEGRAEGKLVRTDRKG